MADDAVPQYVLHHRGEVTPYVVKPLIPYCYDGAWSTTCKVFTPPSQHLTLVTRKNTLKPEIVVEYIDAVFTKEIYCSTTIVYMVRGTLNITQDDQSCTASAGETVLIELEKDDHSPRTIAFKNMMADEPALVIILSIAELVSLEKAEAVHNLVST